jgi:hypothetical protein
MSGSDDPETWTDAETAPVPSKIFKAGVLLLISQLFRLLSLEFFCDSFHDAA